MRIKGVAAELAESESSTVRRRRGYKKQDGTVVPPDPDFPPGYEIGPQTVIFRGEDVQTYKQVLLNRALAKQQAQARRGRKLAVKQPNTEKPTA